MTGISQLASLTLARRRNRPPGPPLGHKGPPRDKPPPPFPPNGAHQLPPPKVHNQLQQELANKLVNVASNGLASPRSRLAAAQMMLRQQPHQVVSAPQLKTGTFIDKPPPPKLVTPPGSANFHVSNGKSVSPPPVSLPPKPKLLPIRTEPICPSRLQVESCKSTQLSPETCQSLTNDSNEDINDGSWKASKGVTLQLDIEEDDQQNDLVAEKKKACRGRGPRLALSLEVELEDDTKDEEQDELHPLPFGSDTSFRSTEKQQDFITVGQFEVRESGIWDNSSSMLLPTHNIKQELILMSSLGQGAGGTVYKAIHRPTMRVVAVKTMAVYDPAKRSQMLKELKALYANMAPIGGSFSEKSFSSREVNEASSQHQPCPFIVTFHDAFINAEQCNVSMVVEYMDGGSLQDIIDMGGCDNEDILSQICYRILCGLKFIHDSHQIHRDIKPGNILINHRGEVKIADFGIVRELESTQAMASTFVGTMIYMSPERINGRAYSSNSDIWSFGLTVMSLAMGTYPLSATGGYWAILSSLNEEPVPRLPHSKFSMEFEDFIEQCLQKDPRLRPSTETLLTHSFILRCKDMVDEQMRRGENVPPTNQEDHVNEVREILASYCRSEIEKEGDLSNFSISESHIETVSKQFGIDPDIVSKIFMEERQIM